MQYGRSIRGQRENRDIGWCYPKTGFLNYIEGESERRAHRAKVFDPFDRAKNNERSQEAKRNLTVDFRKFFD